MQKGKNKGFTLIELLVSISILSVVGASVVGFMTISSKSYTGVNSEVSVQYEAQLTMNQIKDLIIDTNKGVNYCLVSVNDDYKSVDPKNANSETEILNDFYAANPANIDKVKRCLIVYNKNAISDVAAEYPVMKIVWDPVTEEILYAAKTFPTVAGMSADQYLKTLPASAYKLLAEAVTEFSVGLLNVERGQVDLVASFRDGSKSYKTTPTIALRNRIIASDDLRVVYNENNVPKDHLALRVRIKKNGIYITQDNLTVGDVANYEAEVEMQIGATPDNTVTWYLEGSTVDAGKTKSVVDQTGKVTISPDEKSTILTLKAISPKLPTQPAIVTIDVTLMDLTRGYVRSVTLGRELTTGITGTEASGWYSRSYRFEFEDKAPYIIYINEGKVSADKRGVVWSLDTKAPQGSYTWNASNGEIVVFSGANGYNFAITATAKISTIDGTTYASDTENILVSGINEKPSEPEIDIETEKDTISRNDQTTLKATVSQINNPSYRWEIIGYSDNFKANDHWEMSLRKSNVTLKNATSPNVQINVDKNLSWQENFWIELQLTVKGNALNDKGTVVEVVKTEKKKLYINRVKITFEFPDREGNVLKYGDASRTVVPVFENLTGYQGDIEMTIFKYPLQGSGLPQEGNVMSGEFFMYNSKTKQLYLDKNGKTALREEIKNRDRYRKIDVAFRFSNWYQGPQVLPQPIELLLEYEE